MATPGSLDLGPSLWCSQPSAMLSPTVIAVSLPALPPLPVLEWGVPGSCPPGLSVPEAFLGKMRLGVMPVVKSWEPKSRRTLKAVNCCNLVWFNTLQSGEEKVTVFTSLSPCRQPRHPLQQEGSPPLPPPTACCAGLPGSLSLLHYGRIPRLQFQPCREKAPLAISVVAGQR